MYFYFRPQVLGTVSFFQASLDITKAPERSRKAFLGIFPFRWKYNWYQSFEVLRGNGRIFVAPILHRTYARVIGIEGCLS
ncbi:MAG: DUF4336 domain-containing protein [Pseudanabaena sp. M090S1SP1A06QC]|nr:DUF4336 domain-containing protein [Pseudanabaena sp. M53BS1SP1A06MG]MCA6581844.1 DUF4336 domain-containing protein [Pseudanabaena sp. M34BS1SP1A06MG]MCA6590306.1 DUF4336 domain-containing protein [Pseudanabaena sp. M109S1SP1A06QC]MCA6592418.1 DUF4336 domain-containing protein [Pseudanabaena sp. M38BS1SP1A06MG]MCA6599688.1 DUF4336 domain-containing protein [Pseudanabaena sp. M57BS1SP1A06MG]MCA6615243.1 DUF4336 domain-containing protein [Pseudanabaena sp. M090S1SP1A06QC]MCA6621479.1 DUF4336 